jgi:hypothetical protein
VEVVAEVDFFESHRCLNKKRPKGQLLAALGLAEEYDFEPIIKKITKTQPGPKKYSFWSEEEIDFLDENWGKYALKKLAKRLNRTETAIIVKAKRLGLGPTKYNTEYMNARELSGALGVDMHVITDRWIPKYGLKARRKVTLKTFKFWRIKIEDFWAWAEYNQDKFNSRRFEQGTLGKEPGWMQIKRKRDQFILTRRHYKWTPNKDKKLINLFRSGKSYKECGHHLARSVHAVSQRLRRIGWKNVWEVKR